MLEKSMFSKLLDSIFINSFYIIIALALGTATAINLKEVDELTTMKAIANGSFDECDKVSQRWIKARCYRIVFQKENKRCGYFTAGGEIYKDCITKLNSRNKIVEGASISHFSFIFLIFLLTVIFFFIVKTAKSTLYAFLDKNSSFLERFFMQLELNSNYDSKINGRQIAKRYLIFILITGTISFLLFYTTNNY